jgi:hypothetical protein
LRGEAGPRQKRSDPAVLERECWFQVGQGNRRLVISTEPATTTLTQGWIVTSGETNLTLKSPDAASGAGDCVGFKRWAGR